VERDTVAVVPHSFVRDAALIAGFDLRESLRTRRALVLVLLYLLIAAAASGIYVQVVRAIEDTLRAAAGAEADVAMAMARDEGYRGVLLFVSGGDATLANHLATYPAMVLIFAWTSLAFLPWFIALTSYDQIAGDLHLRTIRYAALRTSRAAYVAGKLAAQAALVAGVAALGTLPVILIGAVYLPSFDPVANIGSILATWPITLVYSLAVLGIVCFASQMCRSPGAARAVAVGALFLAWLSSLGLGAWSVLSPLSPWSWKNGLFHPDVPTRVTAVVACLAICLGFTALGYLRFRKRDL
jgi:ABC-type transport system involved in multi-copper enzyme maturation permease subunit